MADHGLRKTFRQYLTPRGFDMLAVETRATMSGVPDTNFCRRGVEGWIEHKRMERGRVTIRPAQVGWIERRLDHGGRVFVAVRYHDQLWLFYGGSVRELQDQKVDQVAHISHFIGGPAGWDWLSIEDTLLRWKPLK